MHIKLLSSRQGNRKFWEWQLEVTGLNYCLPAEKRMNDERLHKFLEANVNADLQFRLRMAPAKLESTHAEQAAAYAISLAIATTINDATGEDSVPTPAVVPPKVPSCGDGFGNG